MIINRYFVSFRDGKGIPVSRKEEGPNRRHIITTIRTDDPQASGFEMRFDRIVAVPHMAVLA